jgi:hypothetical protein
VEKDKTGSKLTSRNDRITSLRRPTASVSSRTVLAALPVGILATGGSGGNAIAHSRAKNRTLPGIFLRGIVDRFEGRLPALRTTAKVRISAPTWYSFAGQVTRHQRFCRLKLSGVEV